MDPRSLGASAVPRSPTQIFDAEVLDDASAPGQEARCIRPGVDPPRFATDPMPWNPLTTAEGTYYPKHGDRAVLAYPLNGPPVILEWWPAPDAIPDILP